MKPDREYKGCHREAIKSALKIVVDNMANKNIPMNDKTSGIGETIQQIRKFRNMTQQELADKAGLTRTTITNIEKGKQTINSKQLPLIAEALNAELIVRFKLK